MFEMFDIGQLTSICTSKATAFLFLTSDNYAGTFEGIAEAP